jgi:hypothetical protein
MISEFLKFYASRFHLIDLPNTRKPGEEVYKVDDWSKVTPVDIKGDYLAVFAGFAYPNDTDSSQTNLIHIKEAYDLVGNGECVRIILDPGKMNNFATLVEGREKTLTLLKLKS